MIFLFMLSFSVIKSHRGLGLPLIDQGFQIESHNAKRLEVTFQQGRYRKFLAFYKTCG